MLGLSRHRPTRLARFATPLLGFALGCVISPETSFSYSGLLVAYEADGQPIGEATVVWLPCSPGSEADSAWFYLSAANAPISVAPPAPDGSRTAEIHLLLTDIPNDPSPSDGPNCNPSSQSPLPIDLWRDGMARTTRYGIEFSWPPLPGPLAQGRTESVYLSDLVALSWEELIFRGTVGFGDIPSIEVLMTLDPQCDAEPVFDCMSTSLALVAKQSLVTLTPSFRR